jgi:hypothetical protein
MARFSSPMGFIGTIDKLTAYTMRNTEGIIVRRKGGHSRKKLKTHESFVNVRRNNAEFGGRAKTTSHIRMALVPQKNIADYPFIGELNKLLVTVQHADRESEWGQRNIFLTRQPSLLCGFELNRKNSFSSIVRSPLEYNINRDTGEASVQLPDLLPGINLFIPGAYPFFSIRASLGIIPDMVFTEHGYKPAVDMKNIGRNIDTTTEWLPSRNGLRKQSLSLQLKELPDGNAWTLILAIGIQLAQVGSDGMPTQAKYVGGATVVQAK